MARKSRPQPQQESPSVPPETGVELISERIEVARALLDKKPLSGDEYEQWKLVTVNYLEKAFGKHSPNISKVADVGVYGGFPMNAGPAWWEQHRRDSLTAQITRMEGLVQVLETEVRLKNHGTAMKKPTPMGHKIFLVHGHEHGLLETVARQLEKLEQEVVILHEKASKGMTLIEKFEAHSDVGFAVVLLTADDEGRAQGDPELRPRARQNVIMELGYFMGKLGRERVCALYAEGVEIPSDYAGVVFVGLDQDGAWRLKLAKELKAAQFPIDMNKAL